MTKEREYYVKIYEEALDAQGSFQNALMAVRNAPAYVDPVLKLAQHIFEVYAEAAYVGPNRPAGSSISGVIRGGVD